MVVLMVGVNGVGKTTTIGKLATKWNGEEKKVVLAAGDTFRAAAVQQLEVWGKRVGAEVVKAGAKRVRILAPSPSRRRRRPAKSARTSFSSTPRVGSTRRSNLMDEIKKGEAH